MAFDKQRAEKNVQLRSLLNERSGWKVRPDWLDEFELMFVTCLGEAGENRPQMLATLLRSDGFLALMRSEEAKPFLEWLARYVEGSFGRPRHRPASPFRAVKVWADRAHEITQKTGCRAKEAISQAREEAKVKGTNLTFEQIQTELRRNKPAKQKTAAKTR